VAGPSGRVVDFKLALCSWPLVPPAVESVPTIWEPT
jgi:hypothetical protein